MHSCREQERRSATKWLEDVEFACEDRNIAKGATAKLFVFTETEILQTEECGCCERSWLISFVSLLTWVWMRILFELSTTDQFSLCIVHLMALYTFILFELFPPVAFSYAFTKMHFDAIEKKKRTCQQSEHHLQCDGALKSKSIYFNINFLCNSFIEKLHNLSNVRKIISQKFLRLLNYCICEKSA